MFNSFLYIKNLSGWLLVSIGIPPDIIAETLALLSSWVIQLMPAPAATLF
jgi:hypothetical protein